MRMTREQRVRVIGSPAYNYSNSDSITDTALWIVSFKVNSSEAKYLPFNKARILNNSNFDLVFYKNQVEQHIVKALSSYTIKYEDIESFKVLALNSGETIPADKVKVQLRKLPVDADEIAREKEEVTAMVLNPFNFNQLLPRLLGR